MAHPETSELQPPVRGVAVVVATLERPAFLLDLLGDLLSQRARPRQILIVDQSRERCDPVERLAADHAERIVYRRVDFQNLPRARNWAWRQARHEAILFLDDDVRCGPELVEEHLWTLRQPGVGLVAGGVAEPVGGRAPSAGPAAFSRWSALPRGSFEALDERDVDHALGANFSVRRSALLRVGGFDERFGVGSALYEELDLCLRLRSAGYRVRFNGRARVRHLKAPAGGCRMVEPMEYVRGLAHNRARLIGRHLSAIQKPVALARLVASGVGLALRQWSPRPLASCIAGGLSGLEGASDAPSMLLDLNPPESPGGLREI